EKTEEIFHSIHSIVIRGKEYIKQNKLDEIGELMNENQTLLEQLGVGHSKLTDLLLILKKNGSMGEKLTGAGGGGCVVGLFDNIKDAHSSMKNIKKKGYQAFTAKHTKIGVTIDE
ncbi:MAG: mevalonate kinase, partial [Candidatus Heimdallarchaeota archaeon]|nr:mevalonate kinase [Candidatus Heimdallarchaeota archaeon]